MYHLGCSCYGEKHYTQPTEFKVQKLWLVTQWRRAWRKHCF